MLCESTARTPGEPWDGPRVRVLSDLRSGRHVEIGAEENDLAALAVRAEHEHLGHERADLLGREVHDGDHPSSDQRGGGVVIRDLGARALDAERTEIDPQL